MIFLQVDPSIQPGSGELAELDTGVLEKAARQTLERAGSSPEVELSIVITGDSQIQELNRRFRGIDAPTDVLSFPSNEVDPDAGAPYLGDVVISAPTAARQADEESHPLMDEMCLLVVHGVLHLLGYDHQQRSEKARMWALQAEILTGLGRSIAGPAQ
jgi:probable rRNA maturation factor